MLLLPRVEIILLHIYILTVSEYMYPNKAYHTIEPHCTPFITYNDYHVIL